MSEKAWSRQVGRGVPPYPLRPLPSTIDNPLPCDDTWKSVIEVFIMVPIEQLARQVLRQHPHIVLGILFGSQATGKATSSSDLDLAVAAEHPLSAQEKRALIEDLALRFGGPVDIVDLMAVSGPILQQALCRGRIQINKRPDIYARLMLKMWYNQADFMPNYRMMLRKRVEAFSHG